MDRHARPTLQRAPTSGSLHGERLLRPGMAPRPRRPSTVSSTASVSGLRGTDSRHPADVDVSTRPSSRESMQHRSTSGTVSPDGQLYACPYAKHDPIRYSHININKDESDYRNCSTGYWTSISRLKQHLYRTHDRSQRCRRCWKYFPTESALREHTERGSCGPKPEPQGLMTAHQHNVVSRREQGKPVESWIKIYQALFPGDELPGSVYPEWVTGEDFRTCFEWLEENLPKLLYREFVKREPNARGSRPTSTTPFLTTAETIQEALEECKESFVACMGDRMTPVFTDDPLTVPPSRSNRHSRTSSANAEFTRRMEEEELDDDSSSMSTTEMNVDDEIRRLDMIRRQRIEEESRRGHIRRRAQEAIHLQDVYGERPSFTVPITTMPFTSAATTYASMPMVTHQEDLMQSMYIGDDTFSGYGLGDMGDYDWTQHEQ
ncbi:hypothetical protein H2198_000963 [Neophaeococcomyces mojaviensis]|uniref:Uncharacterized protein n=1 Tax=Neophaeococcomyces mojaviensis TaxID=3383035 RepID=A0ACC3AIY2_9EURO|nr:hypothetical protein H2198_000963 [Knufia sp. JES_112]